MCFDNNFEGFFAFVALFENFGQRKIVDEYACPICHPEGYVQVRLSTCHVALDVLSKLVCQFTLHILCLNWWLNSRTFFLNFVEVFLASFCQGCFKFVFRGLRTLSKDNLIETTNR